MTKKLLLSGALSCALFSCAHVDPNAHECEIATWGGFAKSAITYTFDDDCHNQFSIAVPIFDKYGYKATFYTDVDRIDNWQTLSMCSEKGYEIGSHTLNHFALSGLDGDELEDELGGSKDVIESNIEYGNCLTLAYPYCDMPDTSVVAKYYIAARVCDCRIENPTPASFYKISSFGVGSESPAFRHAQSIIGLFEKTRDVGGWSTLLIHEVDEGDGYSPISSAAIDSTLMYVKNNESDFWVATFADVVKYIRERNLTHIFLLDCDEESFALSFSNELDYIYDTPISVRRPLPSGWSGALVTQSREVCSSYIKDGYIYFDVVPNKGEVIISKE